MRMHGIDYEYFIDVDFVESSEYAKLVELNNAINGIMEDGAYVQRGERKQSVSSFEEALKSSDHLRQRQTALFFFILCAPHTTK